ncbi:transcriptional regulator, AraC family [Yoonia litorea]|uniref:Transcriptional regulator, AraC family n=2 Tax=Yoonia litorea TaxID=1123755 RepID=A0A1I6LR77_9RHOB|nr:transcriptional regulator, AraC family [Yoonia litorea]
MDSAALLTLSGISLGVALSGLLTVVPRQRYLRAMLGLGAVYFAFVGMLALPLVRTFAGDALLNYMPVLLVLLSVLPPAFFHYIQAKTSPTAPLPVPWRDLIMPAASLVVCIGYWTLPAQTKEMMFLEGELPLGFWPGALALLTFFLLVLWLPVSLAYVVAILRRLRIYRAHIRQLYSDADERDLRWVDVLMALIVLIWITGAGSLADENFADGRLFVAELFLVLIGAGLLVLNIFAPVKIVDARAPAPEPEPDIKYARSALTDDHAAKLAGRIEAAMKKDALYLDPGLSLQKLSQHVGALPNQVSQTLNQEIGASFFDYVARHRIEASKPLIAAGELSVLDVALEVGFNSRSTFYKAFNRETGMTPKDYRRMGQDAA